MKFNILQGKKGESVSLCGRQKYALDEIKDFKFQSPQTIPTATMTIDSLCGATESHVWQKRDV